MSYVDSFVLAVPNKNKAKYIEFAELAADVFKSHGALSVVENWGDDIPEGELTSFPMAVKLEPGETVVCSWIIWPSKAVRDTGMQKSMEDARMQGWDPQAMPFDGKRMIFGGFETIISV